MPDLDGADGVTYTRRRLPHWYQDGAVYFVTFVTWLRTPLSPDERGLVTAACRHWDGKRMRLVVAVVMPDHVHLVLQPSPGVTLASVLHSIKGYSGRAIARARGCSTQVWQAESMDRIVRDGREFEETVAYVTANPVRAGLVPDSAEAISYPWLYVAEDLV